MSTMPIVRLTLYKHGVGFFERRASVSGEEVSLTFRTDEMNDVLKSLTVFDQGGGQVLGVEYPTPQRQEELLAGCSIRLDEGRSLRDLLSSLRGRSVRLNLDQHEDVSGTLLGVDDAGERQPLDTSLVSLLRDESDEVVTVALGRVQGVEIRDLRGARDLRFFLQANLAQELTRQVTVRLSPGEHDLSVSYLAPAPAWRVSYRLVGDPEAADGPRALLQGWGIFENRLDEDLERVSLTLVAGMPMSFVYELYSPHTPERPYVKEEERVVGAPVEMGRVAEEEPAMLAEPSGILRGVAARAPAPVGARARELRPRVAAEPLAKAVSVTTTGADLGELFDYAVGTPVSVRRGQSAMVPILSSELRYSKHLVYNGSKLATYPVATIRLTNETGLVLERGPVTVVERGEYVGEAVFPFTVLGGDVTIAYAVELACKVREESGTERQLRAVRIQGVYLSLEEWDIRWREYHLSNSAAEPRTVLVEHPRALQYELFDSPAPKERTDEHLRFAVDVPGRGESKLRVQERRLTYRREELRQQTSQAMQRYLERGLLDRSKHDQVVALLRTWEQIAAVEARLQELSQERDKIYKAQQQIQGNMKALSATGKEGALRARYVEQLEASENQLAALGTRETELQTELVRLKADAEAQVKALE